LKERGLKFLYFHCSSLSSQEREVGRERFIEFTRVYGKAGIGYPTKNMAKS
jgi:hypothetical protein